ncbi:MAG: 4Fe-4S dicluster domain-containing protein [Chloroflexi bacterium]|nr:4Fe-4S dicluster domain-containing protein [Chloroflexota bacterium]
MTSFVEEVADTPGGEHVFSCIQCGTCTGSCPAASRMTYPPRKLIAMIRAGMREEVLSGSSSWFCLSCYACTVRCPRGVKPTELAHALESLSVRHGFTVAGTRTPAMYRSFVGSVRANGRVHELGMMFRYYMTSPLAALGALPVGLKLLRRRRLTLKPHKSGAADLSRILLTFRESGGGR